MNTIETLPKKTQAKIKRLARKSRREPEQVFAEALDLGLDRIQDEPWFLVCLLEN